MRGLSIRCRRRKSVSEAGSGQPICTSSQSLMSTAFDKNGQDCLALDLYKSLLWIDSVSRLLILQHYLVHLFSRVRRVSTVTCSAAEALSLALEA